MNQVGRARAITKKARFKPNRSEQNLLDFLGDIYPGKFIFNGGQITIEGLIPDFVGVNNQKVLIELIGNQSYPKHLPEALKERERIYMKYGFRVLFLYQKDLAPKNTDTLLEEIHFLLHPPRE